MTNLNKVRQLSISERRLLFKSVITLPAIHVALLVLGYARVRGVMEKLLPLKSIETLSSEIKIVQQAREIARIVSIAAGHGLYKATCLRRSLLVWSFLRRQGFPSHICFGVRKQNRQLEAHAWVEYNGIVINDSADVHEKYQALKDELPPTQFGL